MATFYTSLPLQISSTDPDGSSESCRLLDNRIRETHYLLALMLGLSLDTTYSQAVGLGGLPSAQGIDCRWGGAGTTLAMSAAALMIPSGAGGYTVSYAPSTVTNNITTAGPTANGRDQVGAFGSDTFVYFHWIYNPSSATLASVSSLSPTQPTMPTGYLQGPFAGAMRIGTTANILLPANIRGRWTCYLAGTTNIAADSTSTGSGQVADYSTIVPAGALSIRVRYELHGDVGTGNDTSVNLYDGTGTLICTPTLTDQVAELSGILGDVPNFGQSLTFDVNLVGSGIRPNTRVVLAAAAFENQVSGG